MDYKNRFGQVITDYDPELENICEQIGYGDIDPDDKWRFAVHLVKRFVREKSRSTMHPAIAVLECALSDSEVNPGWSRVFWRVALWDMRRAARKIGDIPGVNDGLMMRWFWTHDQKHVDELAERAKRPDMVGETCRWMLGSVSERHPLLKSQLSSVGYSSWPGV